MLGRFTQNALMSPYTAQPLEVEAPQLAERLTEAIRARGISARQAAIDSGLNKGTVVAWRRGDQRRVQVDKVRQLAGVLGTTAEHLLDLPPTASGQAGTAGPEQIELVRRIAALRPILAQLDSPSEDLLRALTLNTKRLERIEAFLPELREVVEDARRTAPS
jgi:transcriptional regulator with XRE-family HTH domain